MSSKTIDVQIIVKVNGHEYSISSSHEIDEDWDIDMSASQQVEYTALQMQSALNPCFIDHTYDINKIKES